MKRETLSAKQLLVVASMLFGMFFGAGNLIFPVYMGQAAGSSMWLAVLGFVITGVGFPLLAVAALGISRSNGLLELSSRVGRGYGYFFTCALYLTIGPAFAIPRCASTPFSVAVQALLPENCNLAVAQAIFTTIFFAVVLLFSLRPGGILTWIGKILNPVFLVCLSVLVIASLVKPMGEISQIAPSGKYAQAAFAQGFLEGYNTMDALAGLAFGIVVVNVIRGLGVSKPEAVAKNTVLGGVFSCVIMAVIYLFVTVMGAQSRGALPVFSNGGEALAAIAEYYFGKTGALILALIVTFACLKTSVGLVTSCGETFCSMFPKGPSYPVWAVIFCVLSLLVANLGLTSIITYAVPVLMFLYPLAITLILLALCSKLFGGSRCVYVSVTVFALAAAVFDFIHALCDALPTGSVLAAALSPAVALAESVLPLFSYGLGWLAPAGLGLVIGLVIKAVRKPTRR